MKISENKQIAYIVLGMHRSGTSAMGGVLEALGVDFSSNLIPGDPAINLKGYWEHGEINRLHDQLLKNLGSSWDDTKPLRSGWREEGFTLEYQSKLTEVVKNDFGKSQTWGFKDPRLCRLMPMWLDIFKELGIDPYYIIMVRHPEEVADSLSRRNGYSWQHSSLLWTLHFLEAEYYTRKKRRVFIAYDDLLENGWQVVNRIADEFQASWPGDPETAQIKINQLLDGSLKHHRHQKKPVRIKTPSDSICAETFRIANRYVIDPCANDQNKILDELRQSLTKISRQEESNCPFKDESEDEAKIRAIAFYLPQFHPIPENDNWWGKNFTEWTNVTAAKPLFPGHYQPHLPAAGNFYDLRDSAARERQAQLAQEHGIYGFCYYHYWFNGKRLLETPFTEVLQSGKPDFPFCLCWANENWTRRWDGNDQEILMKQDYNHEDDHNFIRDLIPAFSDKRYIRIHGKPLLIIYRAELFPDIRKTIATWRSEMIKAGIGEIYLANVENFVKDVDPSSMGFDAAIEFTPTSDSVGYTVDKMRETEFYQDNEGGLPTASPPYVYDYEIFIQNALLKERPPYKRFRCVFPSWDNTPRRSNDATVFINASPANFEFYLSGTTEKVCREFQGDERIMFINAWNEWGEGCHLEPDEKYRMANLETCKRIFSDSPKHASKGENEVSGSPLKHNPDTLLQLRNKHVYQLALTIKDKTTHIENLTALMKAQAAHIENLEAERKDQDTHIGNLALEIKDKVTHIGNLEAVRKDQELHVGNLETVRKDQELHIGNLTVLMQDKDAHIGNLEAVRKDQETHIGNLSALIRDKDTQVSDLGLVISQKDDRIGNLETELNMIKNSRAWKIAERFRASGYYKLLR